MSATVSPTIFERPQGQTPEERIANALEFIAERMAIMEYNSTVTRIEIMLLNRGFQSFLQGRPR